ncbi:MAG: DUF1559 domain-containing protein, partial [Planctomycetaceae bacterium]|nr:DUF1559 domain-containing protein [Planctomycetaceae bacterium]
IAQDPALAAWYATEGNQFIDVSLAHEVVRCAAAPFMACPSDGNGNKLSVNFRQYWMGPARMGGLQEGRNGNYKMSMGDYAGVITDTQGSADDRLKESYSRGAFQTLTETGMSDITDGTSNTAMISERVTGDGVEESDTAGGHIFQRVYCRDAAVISDGGNTAAFGGARYGGNHVFCPQALLNVCEGKRYRTNAGGTDTPKTSGLAGTMWYCGAGAFSWYSHILPPNGPSFVSSRLVGDMSRTCLVPPTSYHTGGVNVARCDASVAFVTETIDCGNLSGAPLASNPNNTGRSPASPGDYADDRETADGRIISGPDSPSNFGVWGAFGSRAGGEAVSP